ncbi:MAG: hypothetical protein M0Z54_15005 [Thermaerobacter sp.]|nr:hypothetical protein [Thermaerobacter sp.]
MAADATREGAIRQVEAASAQWAPSEAPPGHVGASRFCRGTDDDTLANQYLDEVAEIRDVVAATPREGLAERFRQVQQRARGIPPRPGWVVVDPEGPRSPRPRDWARAAGPRWVVTVQWQGSVPHLDAIP